MAGRKEEMQNWSSDLSTGSEIGGLNSTMHVLQWPGLVTVTAILVKVHETFFPFLLPFFFFSNSVIMPTTEGSCFILLDTAVMLFVLPLYFLILFH